MNKLSWGNFPYHPQTTTQINWIGELENSYQKLNMSFLPFGCGRSYGDSCLASSDKVLALSSLNKFISMDWDNGVLEAEAGVTLANIIDTCLLKGWFLPVTPGTKYVTLGGAIANDVHGKNHHTAGTFGCHVLSFVLYREDKGFVECSLSENSDLYHATIGGLGLTGVIVKVKVKLKKVSSSNMLQKCIKFESLQEFFDLSAAYDDKYEYTVSWIDCLSGKNARGHFMVADHADDGVLEISDKFKLNFPIQSPVSLVNKLTLKPFNTLYYNKQRVKEVNAKVGYEPFFYPLDGILNWNRMYGKKGFQQYQCVVDHENGYDAIHNILKEIKSAGTGSFLAVLKVFGDVKSPGLLSFPKKGVTLALDFPQTKDGNGDLFNRLDSIVAKNNGRLYPAKDAHMSAALFKKSYLNWQQLEKLRDPNIQSRFWQRVTQ
jgi:FAD/FMN-containing dehydrogenase